MSADEKKPKKNLEVRRRMCPLVSAPTMDCYCYDLNSQNIEAAIEYCSGQFEKCRIYRESLQAQGQRDDT